VSTAIHQETQNDLQTLYKPPNSPPPTKSSATKTMYNSPFSHIKKQCLHFSSAGKLKTIYIPAKRTDYYKKRLPEELHSLIVELPAEKKAKK
jgi:hypothetical protein